MASEFMGLGAALDIDGVADAACVVRYEDDGRTLVLVWTDGPTIRFDLQYAGIRLFTELLLERAGKE